MRKTSDGWQTMSKHSDLSATNAGIWDRHKNHWGGPCLVVRSFSAVWAGVVQCCCCWVVLMGVGVLWYQLWVPVRGFV